MPTERELILAESAPVYDDDYVAWLAAQAALIESGQLSALDLAHIAEELRDLASSQRREIKSRLIVLLMHTLKQTITGRSDPSWRGWELTLREQRRQIKALLEASPSLKPYLQSIADECYAVARDDAALALGVSVEMMPVATPNMNEILL